MSRIAGKKEIIAAVTSAKQRYQDDWLILVEGFRAVIDRYYK